jgi:hypothetical protein
MAPASCGTLEQDRLPPEQAPACEVRRGEEGGEKGARPHRAGPPTAAPPRGGLKKEAESPTRIDHLGVPAKLLPTPAAGRAGRLAAPVRTPRVARCS